MPVRSALSVPTSIGDYDIVSSLSATAYRAMASDGRSVVLKLIPADCTVDDKLHPEVHARLARVRELAHPGVANLRSVERDKGTIVAVWEDVPGQPIDLYVREKTDSPVVRRRLARELVTAVESLHRLGVIHGAIHANNALVSVTGVLKLTHVSPYLHEDAATDAAAVGKIIRSIADAGEVPDPSLTHAAAGSTLQTIAARLGTPGGGAADSDAHAVAVRESRQNAWLAAGIVALIGIALTVGIWLIARSMEAAQ